MSLDFCSLWFKVCVCVCVCIESVLAVAVQEC